MTVENQTNKTAPQVMGTSFDYDFTFKVLTEDPTEAAAKEGIKVSVSNDTETVDLEYGTDYTVTLNVNGVGGTVTVTDKRTSDWSLIVYREYDLTQGSDYNNYNAFPAETLERNLDKLTMITQQLSEESSRSVKVGMFSDADPSEIVNEIEVIYANKDDVIAVAQSITDVNAVSADLTNVDIVATNISNVNTVAGDIANVNTVAGDKTNIDTVAGDISRVGLVAGDLTNIDAVASDLTNVDAVSAALTNVGTVAGSIANVNAVGTDISNVNAVSADLTNIDTAAGNIADINTTAANIAAIQDAPTQAANAAASATLAQNWATKMDGQVESTDYSSKYYAGQAAASSNNANIWAEGTDAQVQALGGVHSSKVWAEQSTNANIALTNSPYTTNRILEIPQDINFELSNGTLTLKAGSKVYVPNGFESDGVTPKFDVVVIENDVTQTAGFNTQHSMMYQPSLNNFAHYVQGANLFSGATDPTGVPTISCNYNTTLNKMRFTSNGGSSWSDVDYSLPFAISTSNSSQYTSIDQVFNGFGYIGSTVFALPGVKGEIPNGRNVYGTCKTILTTLTSVKTQTFTGAAQRGWYLQTNGAGSGNSPIYSDTQPAQNYIRWFSQKDNQWYDTHSSPELNSETYILPLALFNTDSTGKITSFEPCTVDSVANSNASNFSQAGRSYLSGLGMPSSRYIDLTLLASGQAYTAPANGWVVLAKTANSDKGWVDISTSSGTVQFNISTFSTYEIAFTIPVHKSESFVVKYDGMRVETNKFRFIYAEGEN